MGINGDERMNNEPFRMSGGGRDADPQAEPKPEEKHEAPRYESKPARRSSHRHTEEKAPKGKMWAYISATVVAAIVVAGGVWFVATSVLGTPGVDSSKYQAVFFTNGQVYFGKLQQLGNGYLKLTDVYYLQTQTTDEDSTNPQSTAKEQQNTTLIKLGEEIHGPEDAMIVSKDQVLFYENLKKDGKVSQSIEQYKSEN